MEFDKTILITRKLKADSILSEWSGNSGIRLVDQSFVKFEPVLGLTIPETGWIFFSSPKGLKLYFQSYPIKANKIGVYGEGTQRALEEFGFKADFIGDSSKASAEIGKSFFAKTGEETVLFPLSQKSLKGISSCGNPDQVIELTTYLNTLEGSEINIQPGIIIFTSPSNVDGFLLKNKIPENGEVIAFGASTAKHLAHLQPGLHVHLPHSPAEEDLVDLVRRIWSD